MSYYQNNPYDQQSGGYGQSAYGQSGSARAANPYQQSSTQQSYSSQPYTQQAQQQGMEMSQMSPTQNGGYASAGPGPQDPQSFMNECRSITDETNSLKARLPELQTAQTRSLSDPNNSAAKSQLESINAAVTTQYKSLMNRLKFLKGRPESGRPVNSSQIGLSERTLKGAWQEFQQMEADYRRKIKEQIERQYRITRPDASEDEVRQATEDPNVQIFSQALMSSNRRGESRTILSNVQQRHTDIQRIERQMTELATLFQQMQEQVIQQEAMIVNTEEKTEETKTQLEGGNEHMGYAVKSAKAARKKKWICFGLTIAIIVVIIIILLIVLAVTHVI